MKITATVRIVMERAGGSTTVVEETATESVGDNPKFEGLEARGLLNHVESIVLDRLPDIPDNIVPSTASLSRYL